MTRRSASTETEIKLRLRPSEPIKRRLRQLGFRVLCRRRFEDNRVYDFEDHSLTRANLLLRLRSENGRHLLTLKGPPQSPERYKIRREVEFEIEPKTVKRLLDLLKVAGLREIFRYQKFRTTYGAPSRAKGLVCLDETPLGTFLELEGTRSWIDRTARRLERAPADYVTASYARLYFEFCRRRGLKAGNMVFPKKGKDKSLTISP